MTDATGYKFKPPGWRTPVIYETTHQVEDTHTIALNRLAAAMEENNRLLTTAAAVAEVKDSQIMKVQKIVAEVCGVRVDRLSSKQLAQEISRPRHIAIALCAQYLNFATFPVIGRHFGGRDRSTVMSAIKRINHLRLHDADISAKYDECESRVIAALEVEG